ncbi:C6 zinc finger domain containing [Cordyceps militaris]|uniref:C6 zinc finger domain containing n=1 Tax=Cordyceps militaris TaxID=73501 RepID=A0A2H4SKP2_CORMI|nr:C6 zinc finger domain containing [Cordyceps militaris]
MSAARPAARRKVRKGTQSCWECKRRKIRCTFAAPTDAVCDGCKSRQTRCVGQEYEDEETPPAGRKADRLRRMESIIEDLVKKKKEHQSAGDESPGDDGSTPDQKYTVPPSLDLHTPEDLTRHLIALWPSQPELDRIVASQACTALLLNGIVCEPYEGHLDTHTACLGQATQRPDPATAHPALVARNAMLLVTLLDSLPPAASARSTALQDQLYAAAARLVAAGHEHMASLHGLESHLVETAYLANRGNLRRAWLVNRRGMSLAQLAGLPTSAAATARSDYVWFRLVCSDRHLSLLLGLPQATTENAFATPAALEALPPLERFERIMVVACSLILQRNGAGQAGDLDTTYEIDTTLQRAAALLTPQWWLVTPPTLARLEGSGAAAFYETTRLMNQFMYHHLLVQLHLPYILLPATADARMDCSRMTVANAARSILMRFVSFHGSPASVSYCRAIDFFAFIASTTLCLVHIEARRQQHLARAGGFSRLQPLVHQRHSDRALLQSLLDIVAGMTQTGPDPIAKRISSILTPLLEIELDSFKGGCYSISAVECQKAAGGRTEFAADFEDSSSAPDVLHIKIPHVGTIRIQNHSELPGSAEPACARSETQEAGLASGQECCSGDSGSGSTLPTPNADCVPCSQPRETDWADSGTLPGPFSSMAHPKDDEWAGHSASLDLGTISEPYLAGSGLSSDDHWALQGVDIALFSNLTQGS